ncbi:glycoside hydrolase family 16 protein [Thermothelomyces thermophilus ATCC 42464]|uniref:Glycoside hydrolase family 16 protein n=1 Tax=Thermothelomyces thermophilus (strain ATCC 42464 / BCRC 31852 / DSM 1799) TaxID=573729 RepID=G2QLD1_THET4|nr:glycoside hydrolase family 16 protein [Thermothelomyces thermophilus ATCC 42464]AEO60763.1 glycoside hydrolase family 16 protein [Thermothelomyces thermophilus ATCC 42464]
MHFTSYLSVLSVLGTSGGVLAWAPPSYDGYRLVWSDAFPGAPGTLPNENNWNIITGNLGVNNELEVYQRDPRNLQMSGGNTLQIVPWLDGSTWSSGRIESKYTFTPQPGGRTMAEAQIRFGSNDISTKQGLWPAFWLLGDSIRHGTGWPACGELDILETINGQLTGYGTAHCTACNEPVGRGGSVPIPNQDFQRWRIVWDLTNGDWRAQTITWFMNDQQFHQLSGATIGDQGVWSTLTNKPLFFILNMAVGGNWPGYPNDRTQGGYGAMMEVGYVAHYST